MWINFSYVRILCIAKVKGHKHEETAISTAKMLWNYINKHYEISLRLKE